MLRQLAYFYAVVALPLISATVPFEIIAKNSTDLINPDDKQFQEVRASFSRAVDEKYITPYDIYWNPIEIIGDAFLNSLCNSRCNQAGNYQNPYNCNQFYMCGAGRVWLWQCPFGGWYVPNPDLCAYSRPDPVDTCPWRSNWNYPGPYGCETLGQRPFWGNLTLPANPKSCCERDIIYCNSFKQVGADKCCIGYGYSKAFMACLPYAWCKKVDSLFHLD